MPMLSITRTEAALLTPPGRGAVASIGICGPEAAGCVERLFRALGRNAWNAGESGRLVLGHWRSSGEEVVLARRGDRIEVHCHGGQASVDLILSDLKKFGCAIVDWPEFDLDESSDPIRRAAEISLAQAPTLRTAAILLDQQHGALSRELAMIKELASQGDCAAAVAGIRKLLTWQRLGTHLTRPFQVVLTGPPNVGKSSLINAILGYERAIVHERPGTTRDVVTARTAIDGWPVELSDTAGIRSAADPLEAAGVSRARATLATADAVIQVIDGTLPLADAGTLRADGITVIAVNKSDLPSAFAPSSPRWLTVSAHTGAGLQELLAALSAILVPLAPPAGAAVPFLDCHFNLLRQTLSLLEQGDALAAVAAIRDFTRC